MSPKGRRTIVILSSAAAILATFLVFLVVPVPQQFALNGTAIYDPNVSCTGIDTFPATLVSFHWSARSFVSFFAVSCTLNQVEYSGNGSSGNGAFVSPGGFIELGAACPEGTCVTANVSGNFTGPLIPV